MGTLFDSPNAPDLRPVDKIRIENISLRTEIESLRADTELLRGANMELRGENVSLRAEVEALRKVFSAAQNLVNNSYTPSCDGDRQRWLMLKDAINTALRGEGE